MHTYEGSNYSDWQPSQKHPHVTLRPDEGDDSCQLVSADELPEGIQIDACNTNLKIHGTLPKRTHIFNAKGLCFEAAGCDSTFSASESIRYDIVGEGCVLTAPIVKEQMIEIPSIAEGTEEAEPPSLMTGLGTAIYSDENPNGNERALESATMNSKIPHIQRSGFDIYLLPASTSASVNAALGKLHRTGFDAKDIHVHAFVVKKDPNPNGTDHEKLLMITSRELGKNKSLDAFIELLAKDSEILLPDNKIGSKTAVLERPEKQMIKGQ